MVGFGKDVVLGLGQLLYGAAKVAHPAGLIHTTLDAQILAEQIKLGNICLESLKQAAAATGQELAKPVVDAWERGDHVEAVTRAGLEIGTLVVAIGQVAKAATATRAGAAAAGAADDVGRAGGAVAGTADDAARAAGAGVADDSAKAAQGGNGVKIREMTNHEKAAFGERTAHDKMTQKGYEPIGTDGNYKPGQTGIDGVYKNPNPPPDYIVTEVKYGDAQLKKGLADGTNQMDDVWILKRLEEKVGIEEAQRIADSLRDGRVDRWLVRVAEDGATTARRIGSDGNAILGNKGKVPGFP